jgi:hypothetical protein
MWCWLVNCRYQAFCFALRTPMMIKKEINREKEWAILVDPEKKKIILTFLKRRGSEKKGDNWAVRRHYKKKGLIPNLVYKQDSRGARLYSMVPRLSSHSTFSILFVC